MASLVQRRHPKSEVALTTPQPVEQSWPGFPPPPGLVLPSRVVDSPVCPLRLVWRCPLAGQSVLCLEAVAGSEGANIPSTPLTLEKAGLQLPPFPLNQICYNSETFLPGPETQLLTCSVEGLLCNCLRL